jgi:hypothetical protein
MHMLDVGSDLWCQLAGCSSSCSITSSSMASGAELLPTSTGGVWLLQLQPLTQLQPVLLALQ